MRLGAALSGLARNLPERGDDRFGRHLPKRLDLRGRNQTRFRDFDIRLLRNGSQQARPDQLVDVRTTATKFPRCLGDTHQLLRAHASIIPNTGNGIDTVRIIDNTRYGIYNVTAFTLLMLGF